MAALAMNSIPSDLTLKDGLKGTDTFSAMKQEWEGYEKAVMKADSAPISMNDLLALMAQIIAASQRMRAEAAQNRITEAVATSNMAMNIADNKCADAQKKFAITLAASVATMALTTAATVKMGKNKTLRTDHVKSMNGGNKLDSKDINDFSSRLQEARIAKYKSIIQMGEQSSGMIGHANEIQHADEVKGQEQAQALKDLKEKFDAQLDQFIQNLTQEAVKLNDILAAMTRASLATNR
ncbi:type III secretion system protein [Vibrio agarivorans]|nr:type III secretion system protein [Vibrio agarivorans]